MSARIAGKRACGVLAAGVLAAGAIIAVPSTAHAQPVSCTVTVADSAAQFSSALQSAVAWWNYALDGTGLNLAVIPAGSDAFVSVSTVSRPAFVDVSPWDDALGVNLFAADGVHSNVWLPDDLAQLSDPAIVTAHELGHSLFADHAYTGMAVTDERSVMGAGHGLGAVKATVNDTDRNQVLSHAAEITALYCPGVTLGSPTHARIPERQVQVTQDEPTGWFEAAESGSSTFAISVQSASRAVVSTRDATPALRAMLGSVPVTETSRRGIASLISANCTGSSAPLVCVPAGRRPAVLLLASQTRNVDNPEWVALGLPR